MGAGEERTSVLSVIFRQKRESNTIQAVVSICLNDIKRPARTAGLCFYAKKSSGDQERQHLTTGGLCRGDFPRCPVLGAGSERVGTRANILYIKHKKTSRRAEPFFVWNAGYIYEPEQHRSPATGPMIRSGGGVKSGKYYPPIFGQVPPDIWASKTGRGESADRGDTLLLQAVSGNC